MNPSLDARVPHVRDLTPGRLAERFAGIGLEARHARRVLRHSILRDDFDLGAIEGLSRAKARMLDAGLRRERLEIVERRASSVDPFVKYLFRAPDGRRFEAVRIPLLQPRWSACISSQAGCAMACAFCMTGRLGFERNLEPWEMVDQVLAIRRDSPERPLWGVVFQGQGEPFCNYENVIRAAEVLRDPCGGAIRGDRMTISTVGILPMIERYAEERHPYRLILSLTSAFPEKRARLVPVGQHYDVADLANAIRRVTLHHGGVIHLAWVLMAGENTQPEEARELRRLFPHDRLRVSVIDVNDPTGRFARAGEEERKAFLGALAEQGIAFVRRYSGGPDIHAACGMLASQRQGGRELPVLSLPGG